MSAKYRRRAHRQHVRTGGLLAQGGALHYAEPMLLVDHHEGKLRHLDGALDQRMSPDHDVDSATRQHRSYVIFDALALPSQQQRHRQRSIQASDIDCHDVLTVGGWIGSGEQLRDGQEMLLRQNLRRRHQGRLLALMRRGDHRGGGNRRFAAADVALKQAPHRPVGPDIGQNLIKGSCLRTRQLERQRRQELIDLLGRSDQRGAGALLTPLVLLSRDRQLHHEQLIERESITGSLFLGLGLRVMHLSDRVTEPDKFQPLQDVIGHELVDLRQRRVQRLFDDASDTRRGEAVCRGIHRDDAARARWIFPMGQLFESRRVQDESPSEYTRLPGNGQPHSRSQRSRHPGLVVPYRSDRPRVIAQGCLGRPSTGSRAGLRRFPNGHDYRLVLAGGQVRDFPYIGIVVVPMWEVKHEVADPLDAHSIQPARGLFGDAVDGGHVIGQKQRFLGIRSRATGLSPNLGLGRVGRGCHFAVWRLRTVEKLSDVVRPARAFVG